MLALMAVERAHRHLFPPDLDSAYDLAKKGHPQQERQGTFQIQKALIEFLRKGKVDEAVRAFKKLY